MLFTYKLLNFFLYPIIILIIYLRTFLKKENKVRYKEKIFSSKFNPQRNLNKKLIWFHASSIGELLSIIPVIDELNNINKNLEFLITTVTLSSANLFEKKLSNYSNITHRFFPVDNQFLVSFFLKTWKPNLVFFVDSEIWPNFLFNIRKKKIPLILLNARITKKTLNKWKIFPIFAKKIFNNFDLCLASSEESKKNLEKLGVKNISYIGNLKFCSKINFTELSNSNKSILDNFHTWCAASTHNGEEEILINAHINIRKKIKNIKTIIIPRHINRVENIKSLVVNSKLTVQILNDEEKIDPNAEVIIINSFGVMEKYYEYCKIVFIGKSLLKKFKQVGGQNPIEPSKLGCKIFHGPYIYNFEEIYKYLNINGLAFLVNSEQELSNKLLEHFENKNNSPFLGKINNLDRYGHQILKFTIDKIKNYISLE